MSRFVRPLQYRIHCNWGRYLNSSRFDIAFNVSNDLVRHLT